MANSRKKGQKTKKPENAASACGETLVKTTATGTLPKENGDLRTAIVDMVLNDDVIMQTSSCKNVVVKPGISDHEAVRLHRCEHSWY